MNHRDFYLCHFLLDQSTRLSPSAIKLYLVDLHRMQSRKKTPMRWLVKDIGSLLFSAMKIGLTKKDYLLFMKLYSGHSLRVALQNKIFWLNVKQRAFDLYKKAYHEEPVFMF